jgi:hypothetical protein
MYAKAQVGDSAQLTISLMMMQVFMSSLIGMPFCLASSFQMLSMSWMNVMKVAGPLVGQKGIMV